MCESKKRVMNTKIHTSRRESTNQFQLFEQGNVNNSDIIIYSVQKIKKKKKLCINREKFSFKLFCQLKCASPNRFSLFRSQFKYTPKVFMEIN